MKIQKPFFAGLVLAVAAVSMPVSAAKEVNKGLNVDDGKEVVTACDIFPLFCVGTQSNGGGKEPGAHNRLNG